MDSPAGDQNPDARVALVHSIFVTIPTFIDFYAA